MTRISQKTNKSIKWLTIKTDYNPSVAARYSGNNSGRLFFCSGEAVENENIKQVRAMIFVDFWNYTLNMKNYDPCFKTNWYELPWAITKALISLLKINVDVFSYQGMFIAGSYDPHKELGLYNWASNTLVQVSGARVDFKPRQKVQSGPCCIGPDHHEITQCPICANSMLGTREKGVDAQIVIEMMKCAWEGAYNVGVIVSNDRDFTPAVSHLADKGIRFVHGRFRSSGGHELRKICWSEIEMTRICSEFKR